MQTIIPMAISVAISLCLLSGIDVLSQFAFYVCTVMNVLAWIGVAGGAVKGEVAERMRRNAWVQLPSSVFSVYALVFSGHPMLGASSFMVQFCVVILAFKKEAV